MPDYSKDIAKAKQKALDALNARIDEMDKATYEILLKAIEDTFDFKDGKILGEKDFIKQLNKLTIDVLDLIQSEIKFTGPVSRFVKRTIPTPAFETAKKIMIDEIIDRMLNNGLNQHFVQLLRDLIYQNVSSGGLSLSDATKQIEEYIEDGKDISGKLAQYIEETAFQAVSAYNGMINMKILQQFPNMNALRVMNPLIDNSSPQCRYVKTELGGIITRENWPKVKAIAEKNGLIEGTTFDNLPFNLLHWYCRHEFSPFIIKKTL